MSEDPKQSPGEPERQLSEEVSPVTPPQEPSSRAQLTSTPEIYVQPAMPQASEQLQYPPPPEFYMQLPAENPYGAPSPGFNTPPAGAGFPHPGYTAPVFPPPAYGYAYGYAPPQAHPLPLGQAIRELPYQYKKILTKPGVRSFAEEKGKADWGIIWLQLLFQMLLQIAISVPTLLNDAASFNNTTSNTPLSSPAIGMIETLALVIFAPLVFFGTVGIQYLLARAFKGTGDFKQQAYNQLLFQVPIGIVSSLLSLILSFTLARSALLNFTINASTTTSAPALNTPYLIALIVVYLISLGLGIYSIVLNVFSLMAAHRISGGRAAGSVLIPYGVLVLLLVLVYCGLFFIILSTVANTAQP